MGAHLEVHLKGIEVVKSSIAELAARVIEDNLPRLTQLSLFQMFLNIEIRIEPLFGCDTSSVIQTNVAESIEKIPKL
jgi:hypothetical protein